MYLPCLHLLRSSALKRSHDGIENTKLRTGKDLVGAGSILFMFSSFLSFSCHLFNLDLVFYEPKCDKHG